MPRLPGPASGAISFQYLAEIAVGATTRVDLCRSLGPHLQGQLLAVKRLHPHLEEDPSFTTQFLDEVWMTAALKHPNVVEVAGWGNDEHGAYLAVELVQGVSLARLMKTVIETGEMFSERLVVYVAACLCRGLAAAHALRSREGELLNLVHRDLTPGNVLLGFKGEVKIADFGLAKAKLRMTKTLTGMLKGEPTYMSPEQARGQGVDCRSDLFSLGVMLFELFAGRHPWAAASEYEIVHLLTTQPPAALRELRPKIDKELVAIVMRCLEKNPAARFQTADEILARLDDWLRAHGYMQGSDEALGRFVRRNAMRQMRWFERAVAGQLAPSVDSMHPASLRQPEPPRIPNFTTTAVPIAKLPKGPAAVRPRASPSAPPARRVQSVPPAQKLPGREEETTDVSDVGSKVAALHARSAPRVIEDPLSDEVPTGEMVDWGEEVPTLVQTAQHQAAVSRALRARPRAPGAMIDEDSDNRTTSIKGPMRGATFAAARLANRNATATDESEEFPTVPLQHPPPILPSARVAPSTPPPAPLRSPPRAPPTTSRPPPMTAPMDPRATRQEGAMRAVALKAPQLDEEPAPQSAEMTRGNEERLLAEADRLALEAVRLREEARVAHAQAERKVAMARVAAQAAAVAAEAVRMASTVGVMEASRRMDEALALEQSVHRAAAAPLAMRPDQGFEPLAPPGHIASPTPQSGIVPSSVPPPAQRLQEVPAAQHHSGAFVPAVAHRSHGGLQVSQQQNRSGAFVPAAAHRSHGGLQVPQQQNRSGAFGPAEAQRSVPFSPAAVQASPARLGAAAIPAPQPMQPTYLQSRPDGTQEPPQAALNTNLEAHKFRARLQPTVLGMPRFWAIIVAVSAFCVVLILLWLFFS